MKVKVFVHMSQSLATGKWEPMLCGFKLDDASYRIFINEQEVEIDEPVGFDPIAGQIAAIRAAKSAEIDRHLKTLQQFNEQLSKLQCIEHAA